MISFRGKTAGGEEHKNDSHVEIPPEVDEATKQRVKLVKNLLIEKS